MGAPPPNPHENNKDLNHPCCPRSANNRDGRKKEDEWGLFAPKPPTRNNVPGPDQFGSPHTRHDGTWVVTLLFGVWYNALLARLAPRNNPANQILAQQSLRVWRYATDRGTHLRQ